VVLGGSVATNREQIRFVYDRLRHGDLQSLLRVARRKRPASAPVAAPARPSARIPDGFLGSVCEGPLVDMGEVGDGRYAGIYSPGYEAGYAETYIHDQFTAGAEDYQRFYTNYEFVENLIRRGMAMAGWADRTPQAILDIGSGAGNSVIPLRRMFPGVELVASDLSLELLRLLAAALRERGMADKVSVMQLNAEELVFKRHSFDLVVGAAILHHLFHPERTLEGCARILGGIAVFFEPMQGANWMLRTLYAAILEDPRAAELPAELRRYLSSRVRFFDDRVCTDKELPQYLRMDDKWMFTKEYFRDIASRAGFRKCLIQPIGNPDQQIRAKLQVHMKGHGTTVAALPKWIQDLIDELEAGIPKPLRGQILGDAIVVMSQ